MAKKKKAARKAASKKTRPATAAPRRRATDVVKGMASIPRLATHPENLIASLNAHAALLEIIVAQIHVLAMGGPGVPAMRAAKDTLKRMMSLRVTEILQRPAGRSKPEYDMSVQLAKAEIRDVMNGAIDRLGRQARGAL
jgi:hypothetical protein